MPSFGIYLPNVGLEGLPSPTEITTYAKHAEDLGFDSAWVEDRLLHKLPILESLTTLTFVAAHTTTLKLGTSVLLVNLRTALSLAKSLSTLDYLTGGRLILGASLGGRADEYLASGESMGRRVSRFRETISAMRALWEEEGANYTSASFTIKDASMLPKPESAIPVWIGGRAEPVLKRVAEMGDGWLASSTLTADEFHSSWTHIVEHCRAIGRDPSTIEPAKFVYIHIDNNRERALTVLRSALSSYYPFPYDVEGSCLYGNLNDCLSLAQKILKSGVRTMIFYPVRSTSDQLEGIARDILPSLR